VTTYRVNQSSTQTTKNTSEEYQSQIDINAKYNERDNALHHGQVMTRCGSNSKHFLAARHGREIDRLHVYAVLAQEQVAQLRVLLGIADLTKNDAFAYSRNSNAVALRQNLTTVL